MRTTLGLLLPIALLLGACSLSHEPAVVSPEGGPPDAATCDPHPSYASSTEHCSGTGVACTTRLDCCSGLCRSEGDAGGSRACAEPVGCAGLGACCETFSDCCGYEPDLGTVSVDCLGTCQLGGILIN